MSAIRSTFQAIGLHRRAGRHEIDDAGAQPQRRRQFDRPGQADAFRLDPALREIATRDVGIFGGDDDMAPAPRIVLPQRVDRGCDRDAALADAEIERRVDLVVVEFHQDIVAGDPDMGGSERDIGRDVEGARAHDVHTGVAGHEAQLAGGRIREGRFGHDPGAREQRQNLRQDAAIGQGEDEFVVGGHGSNRRSEWLRHSRAWPRAAGLIACRRRDVAAATVSARGLRCR